MAQRPLIAVTLGDPSGVGPEVTAAALATLRVQDALIPVVYGDERIWKRACAIVGVPDTLQRVTFAAERVPTLLPVTQLSEQDAAFGKPSLAGAEAQLRYLVEATRALKAGAVQGLCTAPLSKAQVSRTGIAFSGHTEYLAEELGARVLMMLAGPKLRVAVATTHLALSDVARTLSTGELVKDLEILHRELRERFGIARPRLAVCGLNPHAGEGGLFGDEEARIIAPAIAVAKARGIDATGPYAADGLFPRVVDGAFDAVLAMFHDQGLIPVKLLHFDEAVNVTLGLPRPRTSPDHGVAYDLAGTGKARPQSMEAALLLAARLAAPSR